MKYEKNVSIFFDNCGKYVDMSSLATFLKTESFQVLVNEKKLFYFGILLMAFVIEDLRYFTLAFNTRSVMLSERGSQLEYSVILAPSVYLRRTIQAIELFLYLH